MAHPAYTVQLINHASQEYEPGDENIEHSYSLCLYSHVDTCVSANRFIVAQLPTDPLFIRRGYWKGILYTKELTNIDKALRKHVYVTVFLIY